MAAWRCSARRGRRRAGWATRQPITGPVIFLKKHLRVKTPVVMINGEGEFFFQGNTPIFPLSTYMNCLKYENTPQKVILKCHQQQLWGGGGRTGKHWEQLALQVLTCLLSGQMAKFAKLPYTSKDIWGMCSGQSLIFCSILMGAPILDFCKKTGYCLDWPFFV